MTGRRNGFWGDFQSFILRGNVLDLAVAVILGGAFGKIVESLVSDVITPALLSPALQSAKVEDLAKLSFNGILYGKFLAAVLNFLLIAFVIYLGVRTIEALRRRLQTDPSAVASTQERLVASLERLTEVLDSISNSQN
jgi:large conductance mechanosensitive channel